MQLYFNNWQSEFWSLVRETSNLKIISPFVNEPVIRKLQERFDFGHLELITRYKLDDFKKRASSLAALKFAVSSGASIFGIQDLHSKVYLFDANVALVTSANLTTRGLEKNYECGIMVRDETVIRQLTAYFLDLKTAGGTPLSTEQCDHFNMLIDRSGGFQNPRSQLPDFGAIPFKQNAARNYFIKFFGSDDRRAPLNQTTKQELERALCHYACAFGEKKKPRKFRDGDIVYMARMVTPNDFVIFGKATAIQYNEQRDRATPQEIIEQPWKSRYPIYLRVREPVFIDAIMGDCISLYGMVNELGYKSFRSTLDRHNEGELHINPFASLAQQAYIQLSNEAMNWLEPRFQTVLNDFGNIEETFINALPQSMVTI